MEEAPLSPGSPAALTQPTVSWHSSISYFSDKAAEEKIDPIDFAFRETIAVGAAAGASPRAVKPPGGLWDLECGIPAKHDKDPA